MENIKEFAVMVVNGIASWLPEDYKDTEIRLDTVIKNNDLKLTGLIIKKNGSNIAPTIYLEPFYEKYLCGSSLSDVLKEIAELRVESDPCGNYDMSEELIDENSLVYLDPPYRPLSNKSSFTTYAGFEFTDEHQIELGSFYKRISDKGAKAILSNSDPQNEDPNDNFFDDLYKDFNIERVQAKRSINSNGKKRGLINEILVTNY